VLNDATLAAAAVWLLALVIASLTVRRWAGPWAHAHPIAAIAGAAAVARAVPMFALDRGLPFDIEAHWWIGSLALAGRDVYIDPLAAHRYPYPPLLHEYLSALLVWLSHGDRALFLILDKAAPALCGVGIAVAVRAIACRLGRTSGAALYLGLLYAVNPLPVLVTAYHGQFEEIPLLGIVLALLVALPPRAPDRRLVEPRTARTVGRFALSALLLGAAIAYKLWPALFLPPLLLLLYPHAARGLTRARAVVRWLGACLLYGALAALPLVVAIGVYEAAFEHSTLLARARQVLSAHGALGHRVAGDHMLYNMLNYKGSDGFCWGYASVVGKCWDHVYLHANHPNPASKLDGRLLGVALGAVVLALLWRRRPLEGLVALPLAFYLFTPGWGPNYMIWALPFVVLLSATLAARYTAVVLPIVALHYLDSLYAAFNHDNFSWTVLKPLEAALGLLAWVGVAVILARTYGAGGKRSQERDSMAVARAAEPVEPAELAGLRSAGEPAYYPIYGAQTRRL